MDWGNILKFLSPVASKKGREFLFGGEDTLNKFPTGTKEQEALHNNILSQAMGMSQQGGGYNQANQYYNNLLGGNQQQAFDQFSQPYLQQFQEQLLPQIAERFAGAGALSSSGFGQALGGASSNLQSQLAKLFSELQQQAAQQQYGQYNQLSQTGLNHQPFGYNQREGSSGFLPNALGVAGTALAGPGGAALGQGFGGGISNLFKQGGVGGLS
jgi:hypothetical protein